MVIVSLWVYFSQAQCPHCTVNIVDCSFLSLFLFSSFPMSGTTHSYRCLHPNNFAEQSYCHHILPQKPVFDIFLRISNDTVDGNWSRMGKKPLSPLFTAGFTSPLPTIISACGPPVKNWLVSMIRQRCADSARKAKLLQYLVLLGSLLKYQICRHTIMETYFQCKQQPQQRNIPQEF